MSGRGAQALLLLAMAAVWGFGANALRSTPLPLSGEIGPPSTPEFSAGLMSITPASALAAWEAGAFLVDVRAPEDYEARRVAGAVSLPAADFEAGYTGALAHLTLEIPLVVYGSGADSLEVKRVGEQLLQLGHETVNVMIEGFDALAAAGATTAEGPEAAS